MAEPTAAGMDLQKMKPSIVEEFVAGAKKGFYIGAEMIAPAMVLAFCADSVSGYHRTDDDCR